MNIQDELMKIHHKFGVSEMANYKIEQLIEDLVKKDREEQLRLGGVNLQSEQLLQAYQKGFEAATQSLIEANNLVKAKKLQ